LVVSSEDIHSGLFDHLIFSGDQFRAGIERAVALGWICRHESGTYLKFTESGAALFA
jgi:hypothetical protein